MEERKCKHESLTPVAYSNGQHFIEEKELFTTPYTIVQCSECGIMSFGWVDSLES